MSKSISVYIQPNASKNEICGEYNGLLKIRIKAPATENLANKELIIFLSKVLDIKQRQVNIISGFNSRCKTVEFNVDDSCILLDSFFYDYSFCVVCHSI